MAIALDSSSSGRSSSSQTTWSHTVAGSKRLLVVGIDIQDSNHANYPITSVTFGSQSLTKIRSDEAAGNVRTEIWYLLAPNVGTFTITVNSTGGVSELSCGAVSLTGVDQTTPNDANNGTTGNSTSPSVSITTVATNAWTFSVIGSEGAITAYGTQTNRYAAVGDQSYENTAGSTKGPITPAGATTIGYTTGSAPFALSVASFTPSTSTDLDIAVSDTATITDVPSIPATISIGDSGLGILTYRSIDSMKYNKDNVRSQPTDNFIDTYTAFVGSNFNISHIAISVPMETAATFTAAGVAAASPRTPEVYTQKWADSIHNVANKKVLWRGTFCGIEGIYDFTRLTGSNRISTGTVASAPTDGNTTWLGKIYKWITDHPTFFENGDIFAGLPERTEGIFGDSSSFLPSAPAAYNGSTIAATYTQFFIDFDTVAKAAFAAIGKSGVVCSQTANNWSEVASGWIGQGLYDATGVVSFDHYGTANLGYYRDDGFDNTLSVSDNYTLPNAIIETNTNRKYFGPSPVAYVARTSFYVNSKGTGDWTVTIHDGSNNNPPVINPLTGLSAGTMSPVTITNANLPSSGIVNFATIFDAAWNSEYHWHLTSSDGTGSIRCQTGQAGNFGSAIMYVYKAPADSRAMEIDLRKTFAAKGSIPLFHQEWGDFWEGGQDQTARSSYLRGFYDQWSRLAKEGKLKGFNYWGGWDAGSGEQMLTNTGTSSDPVFGLAFNGTILQSYLADYLYDLATMTEDVTIQVVSGNTYNVNVNDTVTITDSPQITVLSGVILDSSTTYTNSLGVNIVNIPFTVNTGLNRMLLVEIATMDIGSTTDSVVSSVTFNGTALTKIRSDSSGNDRLDMWYLLQPSQTTANITITFAGTVSSIIVGAQSFFNVRQSSVPEAQQSLAQSATTTATTNITTVATNAMLVDAVISINSGISITAGSGQTELMNQTNATFLAAGVSYKTTTATGIQSPSWTLNASGDTLYTVISIAPSTDFYAPVSDTVTMTESTSFSFPTDTVDYTISKGEKIGVLIY